MKKTLVAMFTLVALALGIRANAACPCASDCDCPPACGCPSNCCDSCCEKWLGCQCIEDYFCRIGLNECQKCEARKAIEQFKCDTQCIRANGCKCESKCDCRTYRKALRDLDCKMKLLISKCQKSDYKCVRKEVKDQVKCCHSCLINPFKRCKCCECACK